MLSFKVGVLVAFVILSFLGLAILGCGGLTQFLSQPAYEVAGAALLLMGVAALFTNANISAGEREDRANHWVFIPFTLIAILAAYVPASADRGGIWTVGGEAVRWLGVALFCLGGVIRLWPVFVLGNRFSGLVAIQPGHTLVTSGVYRFIRNPSYLGMLIILFGWALIFRSLIGIGLTLLIVPPLITRIHAEEVLLRDHFGEEYSMYCAKTWRLVPGLY